jgi:hypothetical protein
MEWLEKAEEPYGQEHKPEYPMPEYQSYLRK